jgi:hypothetical protein
MTYDEISPTMRQALATWEAFRRLGFSAADIFSMIAKTLAREEDGRVVEVLAFFIALRSQGREFSITIGEIEDADAAEAEWARVANALPGMDEETVRRIWFESEICGRLVALGQSLAAKGFHIPILGN